MWAAPDFPNELQQSWQQRYGCKRQQVRAYGGKAQLDCLYGHKAGTRCLALLPSRNLLATGTSLVLPALIQECQSAYWLRQRDRGRQRGGREGESRLLVFSPLVWLDDEMQRQRHLNERLCMGCRVVGQDSPCLGPYSWHAADDKPLASGHCARYNDGRRLAGMSTDKPIVLMDSLWGKLPL
jgi:hypothetical protein